MVSSKYRRAPATLRPGRQGADRVPVALSIAGSDSSAGAGIQADLKTFNAFNVYGLTAITCVVAEIPGKVSRIEPVSSALVREQIETVAKSFPIGAAKTGLLCSSAIVQVVARALGRFLRAPLVVDPVFIATSGDRLLDPNALALYQKELFRLATLITPNLDEAAELLGEEIPNRRSMERAVRALAEKFRTNVLLKGGHLRGNQAVDLLFAGGKTTEFSSPFVRDVATHGTGCTYSAAITAGLASGLSLVPSIERAKKFVTGAITRRLRWEKNLDALNHWRTGT